LKILDLRIWNKSTKIIFTSGFRNEANYSINFIVVFAISFSTFYRFFW